jgi:DNA helicase II / ATP-dependent DNA helicase PcrA
MSKPFVPSPQQEAIFSDVADGEGHTIVEARAGSAKSTSIEMGLSHLPASVGRDALVVAFNKPIADSMKARVPPGITVSTLHSYGLRQLSRALPQRPEVDKDGDKVRRILIPLLTEAYREYEPEDGEKKPPLDDVLWASRSAAKKTLSLAKSNLAFKPEAIDSIIDDYEIALEPSGLPRSSLVDVTAKALDACLEDQGTVDFDDMIFFPCALKMPMQTYARVFCDELQDLSPSQVKLSLKACDKGARFMGVGDSFQAIYAWRGAGHDVIDSITKKLDAKTLKLTVSFRCAKSIVRLAREIVPDFEAAADAPEGIVREIDANRMEPDAGDFVISRTNAPLVKLFFKFVKDGKRAAIQGRDIGSRLRTIVSKADRGAAKGSVPVMIDNVIKWREKEIARLTKLERDFDNVRDAAACVLAIAENVSTIDEVYSQLDKLFEDNPAGDKSKIILTSGHRSKGLERDRVWLLRNTFMRPRLVKDRKGQPLLDDRGKKIWAPPSAEESRIYYVSLTRARRELILAHGSATEDE